MFCSNFRQLLMLAFSVLILAAETKADVIVTVDISNLNEVVFTTTDAFAEGTFQGQTSNGISLKDFFDGNTFTVTGQTISSDIAVFDAADQSSRELLDTLWVANFGAAYSPNDISFYNPSVNPIFSFDDQRALTGTASFSLTQFIGLPNIGATGNVYFDSPDQDQIIGQWQVIGVPEPSTSIAIALSSLLLLSRRPLRNK